LANTRFSFAKLAVAGLVALLAGYALAFVDEIAAICCGSCVLLRVLSFRIEAAILPMKSHYQRRKIEGGSAGTRTRNQRLKRALLYEGQLNMLTNC